MLNEAVFNNAINVFVVIVLILMLYVRSYNLKKLNPKPTTTPFRIMIFGMIITFIVSAMVLNGTGIIIEGGLRPLGAGIWYLIIVGILSLFKKNKNNKASL